MWHGRKKCSNAAVYYIYCEHIVWSVYEMETGHRAVASYHVSYFLYFFSQDQRGLWHLAHLMTHPFDEELVIVSQAV